jgi:ABC-type phosphate transport system ATPase subunit
MTSWCMEARNVDFFYGKNQALFGVDLPVRRNAITALIGPSGCGKSTLLRVLNRIYALYPGQRAVGRVVLDGEDVLHEQRRLPWLRKRVSMVSGDTDRRRPDRGGAGAARRHRSRAPARPRRHGVPEADTVSDVDL